MYPAAGLFSLGACLPDGLSSMAEPGIGRGKLIGVYFYPTGLNWAFVSQGQKPIQH
jgi:hypothetical protein